MSPTPGRPRGAAREPFEQRVAQPCRPFREPLVAAARRSRRARRRGSPHCRGTSRCGRPGAQCAIDRRTPDDRRQRQSATDALADRHQVGHDAPMVGGPSPAGPPEPRTGSRRRRARTPWRSHSARRPCEEAVGWHDDAAVALDRLDDDRRERPDPRRRVLERVSARARAPRRRGRGRRARAASGTRRDRAGSAPRRRVRRSSGTRTCRSGRRRRRRGRSSRRRTPGPRAGRSPCARA